MRNCDKTKVVILVELF